MRINVYAEELTDKLEIVEKQADNETFTGLRMYMHLPVTLPDGTQAAGPFMHRPGDDDSSAVTFWGKRKLREILRKALDLLDKHYGDTATVKTEPPRVLIVVEGGNVQDIYSNTELSVLVKDWDCIKEDPENAASVLTDAEGDFSNRSCEVVINEDLRAFATLGLLQHLPAGDPRTRKT